MFLLQNNLFDFLTYLTLATSIMSFWVVKDKKIPIGLFLISAAFGLVSNQIEYWFLLSILPLGVCLFLFHFEAKKPYVRLLLFLAIVTITILLLIHKIHGYNNWQILPDVKLSDNSTNYSFWLNFDKPIIGFLLLLFIYKPIRKLADWKEIFKKEYLPFYLKSILILLTLGIFSSYLVFDLKTIDFGFLALWSFKMLFFTVIIEELFFRFFIQNNIIKSLGNIKNAKIIGVIISSLIFGVFHLPAGILFALLAFVAGLIYGGIYLKTNRLESAILLHFLVNFIHLIFFSYPSSA
jgi:membrane protease YdiL (CAAX protease family)